MILRFLNALALQSALFVAASTVCAQGPDVLWNRSFGTAASDQALGVAADSAGYAYAVGRTTGSLDGPHAGSFDVFLRKYSPEGTLEWSEQLSGPGDDAARDVVVDPFGHAIVVGHTTLGFDESTGGALSAFVAKFDATGQRLWTQQFSDNLGSQGVQVAVDAAGNIFASGLTIALGGLFQSQSQDAFITKFDPAGVRQWTRKFGGTRDDIAWGVSADALGNTYVSGETQDDTFLRKYDPAGGLLWERQIAPGPAGYARSHGVSIDVLGNVFIAGNYQADLGQPYYGRFDAYVAKYDAEGTLAWIRTLGSSENDNAEGISTDGLGNVFVTGFTEGEMTKEVGGQRDFFVAKYDSSGQQLWVEQFSTASHDNSFDIAADGFGSAYVAGVSFNADDATRDNALLMKLRDTSHVPLSADFNNDGAVGREDLHMWETSFGGDNLADANGDGVTDGDDFLAWQTQYTGSFRPSAIAVPEPATLSLSLATLVALRRQRRTQGMWCSR
jgi:hypothetical protein